MTLRKIGRIYRGEEKKEGAGVKIKRIFDRKTIKEMDPFLMMDFFDSKNPDDYKGGFPWHPHRGLETITYMVEGEVYHEDTLGNKGSIVGGECQWMVAGNGIMHQEMMVESPSLLGVQIWLNTLGRDKMKNPSYRDLRRDDIRRIKEDGYELGVLSGSYKEVEGPVKREDRVKPKIFDLKLKASREFSYKEPRERTVFVFILEGELDIQGTLLRKGEGLSYERNSGDLVSIFAREDSRVLILSGYPLKEEVQWEGPIVMNTKEELDLAFDELNRQEFIKYRGEKSRIK